MYMPTRTARAALPQISERGGQLVFIASVYSFANGLLASPYAASKAALIGLMRSAALETVTDGITVNAVQPGNVRTAGLAHIDPELLAAVERSIPIGRLAEPDEVGWVVRFFASDEAAYVTGQSLVIDGGQVLPEAAG